MNAVPANPTAPRTSPVNIAGRAPNRAAALPPSGAAAIALQACGASARPASQASRPRVRWKNRDSTKSWPKKLTFRQNPTVTATVKPRPANRPGGSIGSGTRRSTATKPINSPAPTAAAASCGIPQPCSPAEITAQVPTASPSAESPGPNRSRPRGAAPRVPSTAPTVSRTATAITGRLIQNTDRHPTAVTSIPPRIGPTAAATPPAPPHRPIARARAAGSEWMAPSSVSDPGTTAAAPTPCTARAATSAPPVGAIAQAKDRTPNPSRPIR